MLPYQKIQSVSSIHALDVFLTLSTLNHFGKLIPTETRNLQKPDIFPMSTITNPIWLSVCSSFHFASFKD